MVKIFALRERLLGRRGMLSDLVQQALHDALGVPLEKRAHRFFPLEREDLVMPPDRSEAYTLIEFSLITGRSSAAKKQLVRMLFERMEREAGISPVDLEIVIHEAPGENWGFRGLHGDEAKLNYAIKV